jgi:hypothetical protein
MEHLIKLVAQHWDLNSAQYWHLRLLSALSVAPLIGVLCVVLFDRPKQAQLPKLPLYK